MTVREHLTQIGETVCVNKPGSSHHQKFGEYVGLANVFDWQEPKYRVDLGDGQIYLFTETELIVV